MSLWYQINDNRTLCDHSLLRLGSWLASCRRFICNLCIVAVHHTFENNNHTHERVTHTLKWHHDMEASDSERIIINSYDAIRYSTKTIIDNKSLFLGIGVLNQTNNVNHAVTQCINLRTCMQFPIIKFNAENNIVESVIKDILEFGLHQPMCNQVWLLYNSIQPSATQIWSINVQI